MHDEFGYLLKRHIPIDDYHRLRSYVRLHYGQFGVQVIKAWNPHWTMDFAFFCKLDKSLYKEGRESVMIGWRVIVPEHMRPRFERTFGELIETSSAKIVRSDNACEKAIARGW